MRTLRRVILENDRAKKEEARAKTGATPEIRSAYSRSGRNIRKASDTFEKLIDRVRGPKPENSNTAYPLTANRVHIHEINIVNGKLTAGKGTRLKPVGPLTRLAIKKRDAGQATPASETTLERAKTSDTNTAVRRPSKFKGPRVRTKAKKPVKPNTEPLPGGFKGGDAGSTRSIQTQVASKK